MNISDVTNFLGITNTKVKEAAPPTKAEFEIEKAGEKKVLHAWSTTAKVQKKQINQKKLKTLLVIAIVVVLLLAIMQEFFLILVLASIVFISHVLSATSPEKVEYEITNHGIEYAGQFYYWNELKHFFFTENKAGETLNVDTKQGLPVRLFLTIKTEDKEKLEKICGSYLPQLDKKPEDFIDKTYTSITNKLDLTSN